MRTALRLGLNHCLSCGLILSGIGALTSCNSIKSLIGGDENSADESPSRAVERVQAAASAAAAEAAAKVASEKAAAEAQMQAELAALRKQAQLNVLPPATTQVPTVEQWDAQTKEVTVKGSSALNCETKVVGEYLRVHCRGQSHTGGLPSGVRIVKGKPNQVKQRESPGSVEFIVPWVNGVDLALDVVWSDKTSRLRVLWPNGSPAPQIVGGFEGAPSPIDANLLLAAKNRLCECLGSSCATAGLQPQVDCDRTYKNDCSKLLACTTGAPSVPPSCLGGQKNAGPLNWCMTACTSTKDCASGETCSQDWGNVCLTQ